MATAELTSGRIHYEEAGPRDGRPVVCVHGFLMSSTLWGELSTRLAARGLRCISPTLPLGAHSEPMRPGTDLSPRGIARLVADFLEALDLDDVVLVGNDSGGAISQIVAVDHPERVGALVLTNCDTFEHFPPSVFKALVPIAKVPAAFRAALTPYRVGALRRSPAGFGLLSHADVDHLSSVWLRTAFGTDGALEDVRRFVATLDAALTIDAAERLPRFDGPVVLAWGQDDVLFRPSHAERLAAAVPHARLVRIAGSRTFVMIDRPDRLADVVSEVAGAVPVAAAAAR